MNTAISGTLRLIPDEASILGTLRLLIVQTIETNFCC